MQKTTRVYLLGVVRAIGPTGDDVLPRAKKTQAVLAYLCLAQGKRLQRSHVAGMIWDRSGETQARDSLRHALSELVRMGTWRIETDHETVRLDAQGCWVDAYETPDRPDLLLDSLYGISPTFDQWLVGERIRFERRWQTTLETELHDLIAKQAAPELRAAAARKLLNFLPTHEPAVRSLMMAFADIGDPAQAIREYERFRLVIGSDLGMAPSKKTVAVYEAIRLESRARTTRVSSWYPQSTRSIGEPQNRGRTLLEAGASGAAAERDLQPSIAVLPLRNLSREPAHSLVAEGLVEDLVEAVSRLPSLLVISRLSTAMFRNQDRSAREIGDVLGVRYILSGSIRIERERLRLVVELIETDSGRALWVSRFDEKDCDLLEIQNRLAAAVVRYIAPHVRAAEVTRMRIKHPQRYDAYDLLLRAQENMNTPSREIFESSERLFEAAVAREPGYAAAHAWRAYWHVMRIGQGWSPDQSADTRQAEYFAQRAIECDDLEPMAYAVQGHAAAYLRKDFDMAFACFERAREINPNSARAWLWNASAHAWSGDGGHAVEKINRAMALSPYDPLICAYSVSASMAYFADGQYARALEFALRCIRENRVYTSPYKLLIASLVMTGRTREARAPLHQLFLLEPDFTVQQFRHRFPGSAWPIGDLFCNALARAGTPRSN